jgi:hypothetical protein
MITLQARPMPSTDLERSRAGVVVAGDSDAASFASCARDARAPSPAAS